LADERSRGVTPRSAGLVEILDRILDKGLIIAGDIKISLVSVELLTLKIRLIICSIDKAEQIGLNWWRFDPSLTRPVEGSDGQGVLEEGSAESAPGREQLVESEPEHQAPALDPPRAAIVGQLQDVIDRLEGENQQEAPAPPRTERGAARRGKGQARS